MVSAIEKRKLGLLGLLKSRRLSVRQLARLLGINPNTIYGWFKNGRITAPAFDALLEQLAIKPTVLECLGFERGAYYSLRPDVALPIDQVMLAPQHLGQALVLAAQYTLIVLPMKRGKFHGVVLELPEVVSEGDSALACCASLHAHLIDALALRLLRGRRLPVPSARNRQQKFKLLLNRL